MDRAGKQRMTKEQREEALRRVLAGEKQAVLAAEYGVTRAYISLLKAQAVKPGMFAEKRERKFKRKPTQAELALLREKMHGALPYDFGLAPAGRFWTVEHGIELGKALFGKQLSRRVVEENLPPPPPRDPDYLLRRPKPPEKHDISRLDKELASDPDFVKYYLSPVAERIAWREYELALEDWVKRYGDVEMVDLRKVHGQGVDDPDEVEWEGMSGPGGMQRPPAPGRRVGKHAGSKGSPFTPSKKKRRKKR